MLPERSLSLRDPGETRVPLQEQLSNFLARLLNTSHRTGRGGRQMKHKMRTKCWKSVTWRLTPWTSVLLMLLMCHIFRYRARWLVRYRPERHSLLWCALCLLGNQDPRFTWTSGFPGKQAGPSSSSHRLDHPLSTQFEHIAPPDKRKLCLRIQSTRGNKMIIIDTSYKCFTHANTFQYKAIGKFQISVINLALFRGMKSGLKTR